MSCYIATINVPKQSVIKVFISSRYVIQVWEPINSPLLNQLIKQGYRTVSVPKDIWYLDHGFWGATKYSNWRRMYAHTLPRDDNFLGGEVAMWTEYLDEQGLGEWILFNYYKYRVTAFIIYFF